MRNPKAGRALRGARLCIVMASVGGCSDAAEPDPTSLLERGAAAIAGMATLRYEARYESRSAGDTTPRVATGTVVVDRTGDGPEGFRGRLLLRRDLPSGDVVTAFDGTLVRFVDHGSREMMEARPDDDGTIILRSSPPILLLLRDLLDDEPLRIERTALEAAYGGIDTVAGEPTHVVRVRYDRVALRNDLTEGTWWLSIADGLPRRYERVLDAPDGPGRQSLTLSRVESMQPSLIDFGMDLPVGYRFAPIPGAPHPLEVGAPAPPASLPDPTGASVDIVGRPGESTLLVFWASWCGWCRVGLDELETIRARYQPQGLRVLGVNWRESEGVDPEAFLAREGFEIPTTVAGERIEAAYRVGTVPTYYVIDRAGRIAFAQAGFDPQSQDRLRSVLDSLTDSAGR